MDDLRDDIKKLKRHIARNKDIEVCAALTISLNKLEELWQYNLKCQTKH